MQEKLSIFDRLESFASQGVTSAKLRLWDKQRKQLEGDGFEVTILASTGRKGENFCLIDWKAPTAQTCIRNVGYQLQPHICGELKICVYSPFYVLRKRGFFYYIG